MESIRGVVACSEKGATEFSCRGRWLIDSGEHGEAGTMHGMRRLEFVFTRHRIFNCKRSRAASAAGPAHVPRPRKFQKLFKADPNHITKNSTGPGGVSGGVSDGPSKGRGAGGAQAVRPTAPKRAFP